MGIFGKSTLEMNKPEVISNEPAWLVIARKELGTREVKGGENKRIIEYHAATSLKAKEDEIPWCSSFVNWCLKQAGIKGTESAWARDWLKWGVKLDIPRIGCICLIERNSPGGDSHVFFYLGEENGKVIAYGGNQGDSVSIAKYDKSLVLGYRWPTDAASTPLPPKSSSIATDLSWEKSHPERQMWSDYLFSLVRGEHFSVLSSAQDIELFRPDFKSLNDDQKATVICEIFASMALYESSWNPKSASVDVGKPDQKDTWSIGLLQMSVVDQVSYNCPLGYSYDDLLTPLPNLHLGVVVMAKQIKKHRRFILSSSVYWAVLKEGGRYQKIGEITSKTKALKL